MVRNLVLVLGDQLDAGSSAFDGFDKKRDAVWMAEVREESTHAWSHKVRIVSFLSAMRHFRDELRARGIQVQYRALEDAGNLHSFGGELEAAIARLRPKRLIVAEPGEWRVREALRSASVELEIRPDRGFLCSIDEFRKWADAHKQLRMEFFYRHMRERYSYLMERGEPVGGKWNFDPENRKSFGKAAPIGLPR